MPDQTEITVQLVRTRGEIFYLSAPIESIADCGVIFHIGLTFVYEHSTSFRTQPRFVEVKSFDTETMRLPERVVTPDLPVGASSASEQYVVEHALLKVNAIRPIMTFAAYRAELRGLVAAGLKRKIFSYSEFEEILRNVTRNSAVSHWVNNNDSAFAPYIDKAPD